VQVHKSRVLVNVNKRAERFLLIVNEIGSIGRCSTRMKGGNVKALISSGSVSE